MEDQIVTQVKKYLNSNKKTLWTILVTAIVTMVAFYKFSSLNIAFISSPHSVKLEINDESKVHSYSLYRFLSLFI